MHAVTERNVCPRGFSSLPTHHHQVKWRNTLFRKGALFLLIHQHKAALCCNTQYKIYCKQLTNIWLWQSSTKISCPTISSCLHSLWRWNRMSDLKCRHIKFSCWGITQKNTTVPANVRQHILVTSLSLSVSCSHYDCCSPGHIPSQYS